MRRRRARRRRRGREARRMSRPITMIILLAITLLLLTVIGVAVSPANIHSLLTVLIRMARTKRIISTMMSTPKTLPKITIKWRFAGETATPIAVRRSRVIANKIIIVIGLLILLAPLPLLLLLALLLLINYGDITVGPGLPQPILRNHCPNCDHPH